MTWCLVICKGGPWHVPSSAILPLVYWVIFTSVIAYSLLTWASRQSLPSSVLAYMALQPLTTVLLTVITLITEIIVITLIALIALITLITL